MTMMSNLQRLPVLGLMVAVSLPLASADEHDEEPFPVGRLYFQLNDTDGDLGIHLLVDGEPWKTLEIDDANDRRMFFVRSEGRLRRQGLTEFKFESAEPDFETFPAERFFRRFPEGEYDIEAARQDGGEYETTAIVSHLLPAPPMDLAVDGMEIPEDCEETPVMSLSVAPTLSWSAVTESHEELGTQPPVGIGIVRYEVAVEREGDAEEGIPSLNLQMNLEVAPGEHVTDFVVPAGLLEPDDEIKFQILVEAENGNETSAESCFIVAGG